MRIATSSGCRSWRTHWKTPGVRTRRSEPIVERRSRTSAVVGSLTSCSQRSSMIAEPPTSADRLHECKITITQVIHEVAMQQKYLVVLAMLTANNLVFAASADKNAPRPLPQDVV